MYWDALYYWFGNSEFINSVIKRYVHINAHTIVIYLLANRLNIIVQRTIDWPL